MFAVERLRLLVSQLDAEVLTEELEHSIRCIATCFRPVRIPVARKLNTVWALDIEKFKKQKNYFF
jgi:hypothetical protein